MPNFDSNCLKIQSVLSQSYKHCKVSGVHKLTHDQGSDALADAEGCSQEGEDHPLQGNEAFQHNHLWWYKKFTKKFSI